MSGFFPSRSRGFALVVTLSLLVVMTLVATALLSLSSIALRSASRVNDQESRGPMPGWLW